MKDLTKRQAIILFAILTISIKLQRLPALISADFSRDSYIAFLCLFLFDFLLLLVVLKVYKKLGDQTIFEYIKTNGGQFWLIVFCILTILFFLSKSLLSFKQLHEFFANTLFNRLPWNVFSILFIALLVLCVGNGLKNIGRNGEFYLVIMSVSIIAIMILGVINADYHRILPILDIDIPSKAPLLTKYWGWFLDPIALLFFAGNVKQDKHPTRAFLWTHIISAAFVVFGMATFYAINENMVEFQSNGLTSMTEFTLIQLGVGRPDWFLVLFVNISNVIVTAFFVWVVTKSMVTMFNKNVNYLNSSIVLIIVYVLDEFVYKNLQTTVFITTSYASYFMAVYAIIVPLAILLSRQKSNRKLRLGGAI